MKKNIISASLTTLKSLTLWITTNWKTLKEMGMSDHFKTFPLRNPIQVNEQMLEQDMEKWTRSKWRKEYVKAVYGHSAYLTYMQSISCKMLSWMKHKLESRLLVKISTTSDMQITPPLWQTVKRN